MAYRVNAVRYPEFTISESRHNRVSRHRQAEMSGDELKDLDAERNVQK